MHLTLIDDGNVSLKSELPDLLAIKSLIEQNVCLRVRLSFLVMCDIMKLYNGQVHI